MYVFAEAEGRLGMGVWGAEPPTKKGGRRPNGNGGLGAEPPNGGMAAIPNSEVTSITPELLFPHLGAGDIPT